MIKFMRKSVPERRRIYMDYSCWLEDAEALTDFQTEVSPFTEGAPLTVDTSWPDSTHKKLMVFVSGGVANTDYTVSMLVRTDGGQVKRDDLGMKVTP
jgi:hypothetical protein